MSQSNIVEGGSARSGAISPSLQLVGTCQYLVGLLTPWRTAYRVSAKPSGHEFFVTPSDVVGRHISKYGAHEPGLTAWIKRYLDSANEHGIVVDVGANLGWHTVHAAKHPSVKTVVAYEPDAFNAWLLDRNIQQNGISNVVVNVQALGSSSGTALLHSYKASNKGRHSLAFSHGLRSRTVPLGTLDASLDALGLSNEIILLIKIDVEGYEPAVLSGAARTLPKVRTALIEYDPLSTLKDDLSPQKAIDMLLLAGLEPYVLIEDARLAPPISQPLRPRDVRSI